eukprot:scaffold31.g3773.t1
MTVLKVPVPLPLCEARQRCHQRKSFYGSQFHQNDLMVAVEILKLPFTNAPFTATGISPIRILTQEPV